TCYRLDKSLARLYSGIPLEGSDIKIGLVGVGAIGSQVFLNLSRMGFGKWRLLDKDIFLPHNFVRHGVTLDCPGKSKAIVTSNLAKLLLHEPDHSSALIHDYLTPKNESEISQHFRDLDVIVDMSASDPVARKLSDDDHFSC